MAKNSMRIGFELSNFQEMRSTLSELPASVQARVLKVAVEKAAKPIVRIAKAKAPRDTGALARSITAVVRTYPRRGKVMAIIGPDTDRYTGSGKRAKSGEATARRPGKYAHLVEFGHHTAAGGGLLSANKGKTIREGTLNATAYVRAQPFLRPAVTAGTPQAVGELARGVEVGMEREIKRQVSKLKRIRRGK